MGLGALATVPHVPGVQAFYIAGGPAQLDNLKQSAPRRLCYMAADGLRVGGDVFELRAAGWCWCMGCVLWVRRVRREYGLAMLRPCLGCAPQLLPATA